MKHIHYILISLLLMGCASKAVWKATKEHLNKKDYDPSEISFLDLDSGQELTLSSYMETEKKEWVLLYFHSRSCEACVEKMKIIRDQVSDDTFRNSKFEIVAVSTDPVSSVELVKRFKAQNNFPFVKWLDSRGEDLKDYYLRGADIGVPYTAFVNKTEILWSYDNTQHYELEELVAKIKETVPEEQEPVDQFYLYDGQSNKGLSKLTKNAEYTIINAFGELCSSCFDELDQWNKPGDAFDLCQLPKCQFLNLENGYIEDEPVIQHYGRMKQLLTDRGYTSINLILDPSPSDGENWEKRYFDGYLTNRFPNWEGLFGAVVYKDGEIVKDFKAGDPHEITEYIKSL